MRDSRLTIPAIMALILSAGGAITTARGQQPAAAPAEAPKAIVDRVCQSCHDMSTLSQNPHKAGEWPGIVQRMRSYGADLTDAEAKQAADYLAATRSAKP